MSAPRTSGMVDVVDTTTARRQPEPVERDRPHDVRHRRDRAHHRPRRLPRGGLHVEHPHGRGGPLPPGGPLGAAQARPLGDAGDPARVHHDRHALHHLGARRRGRNAARVPLCRTQRDSPLPVRRPLQRPGPSAARRRAGPRGGRRGGDHRTDVLGQRGAHPRVLRRTCRRARRLRRHGRPLPQGSRRSADAGGRAGAGAALPSRRSWASGRAAQPLHDRPRAVRLRGGAARRVRRAPHRRRAPGPRDVQPGGRDDASRPGGGGLLAPPGRRRSRRDVGVLPGARAREGPSGRRAAGVRLDLLPPPARGRDGLHDAADARRAAQARAVPPRARGGRPRTGRDGIPDHRHAGVAARCDSGGAERHRRRALVERLGRDRPLLPRPLRRARPRPSTPTSPTASSRGRAPRS